MNIYQYVAANNEYGAMSILDKYGYTAENINSAEDVGTCLQQLVKEVGTDTAEDVIRDIVSIHPDKDLILEVSSGISKKKDCSCKKKEAYVPAPADSIKESHLFIFAGALLLAAAIISK